ncbi:MAG: phosphoribosylanthranilate isomerase [Chlorobiaceae bacterium]|nr:phosphoribosylanthranilate isomerase [Chlorobiaceae bacterium]
MVKIKICGITRLEDALLACNAGVDALGFNFSIKSPRYITPDNARAIIEQLPPFVTCTGIFVEHSPPEINAIASHSGLQAAQLHSAAYTAEQAKAVTCARLIKVFHPKPGFTVQEVRSFSKESGVNCFLFDTYRPGVEGGTGEQIDAPLAAQIFHELGEDYYGILAGGLNADNAAKAVSSTRPWAVDTASGVESAPGIKSAEKIHHFIQAVRNAAQQD